MEISPILLFRLLLYSFAFGAILGVVNDVSRILRVFCGVRYSEKRFGRWYERELPLIHRPLNRGKQGRFSGALLQVLIFFQDVFLFLTAGVGLVILNYEMNQGRFRFYTVFAMIAGFAVYYFTLGKLVMLVSEGIVFLIRATLTIVFGLFLRPFCLFYRFFMKKMERIRIFFQTAIAKRKKKLYNKNEQKRLRQEAGNGFLSEDVP